MIRSIIPDDYYLLVKGFCPVCNSESRFFSNNSWLRESLHCDNCRSISRERALMLEIEKHVPQWRGLRIHESSPNGGALSTKLKNECCNYTASQYYPSHVFGDMVGEFRNEDLERQSFADGTFDLVITQDVLEHVYDPQSAFKEICRTLADGGMHIFTVPIENKHAETQVWAEKGDDGSPIFLFYPEYHGNPIDENGSPVTMHWGYDIVNFIQAATNMDTTVITARNARCGIEGDVEVFVSIKKEV